MFKNQKIFAKENREAYFCKNRIIMTKFFKIIFVFLASICFLSIEDACAAEKKVIYHRFEQSSVSNGSMAKSGPIMRKSQRMNNQAGRIKVSYEGIVPAELKTGIEAAADRWSSVIRNEQLIRVVVLMDDLPANLCAAVEVGYGYLDNVYVLYPTTLLAELTGLEQSDDVWPNAIIVLNSNTDWDTSFSPADDITGINIYSCTLRSLALACGFGSSVLTSDGGISYDFYDMNPSIFDNLILSEDQRMASLPRLSKELKNFVTLKNIYAISVKPEYKLYSPNPFESGKSLIYYDNVNSLMHYDFGMGDCMFNVDQYTVDALNEIGWGIKRENARRIICDDIGDNGLGSAYSSHVFRLEDNSSIGSYEWSFILYEQNGEERVISTATSSDFMIKAIESPNEFKKNSEGDIIGRVKCDYSIGGKQESAYFSVFLELQPVILSVEKQEIHQAEDYEGYYLTFDVYYQGSDTIYIDLEEEYSSSLRSQIIYSPYKATIKTGNINPYNYAWVDIKVYNKYGSAVETIELEPTTELSAGLDYEISNVKYDYAVEFINGKYDISGDFSFDVKVSNTPRFIVAHTNPYSHIEHFYSVQHNFNADPAGVVETKFVHSSIKPGVFFRLRIQRKDGSFFSSPEFCSTDYIREDDKNLYFSGVMDQALSSDIKIGLDHSSLYISGCVAMKEVKIMDMNGKEVKAIELDDSNRCEIDISDMARGFYIIKIIDSKDYECNKKFMY